MWTAREEPIDSPDAAALLRAYFVEVVDRYHGRPMPASLVDRAMAEDPNTGIAAFIVARFDGAAARARGLTRLRLDTRTDLVEAWALYAATGYAEVERFNDEPFAEHWFEKRLT